MTPSPELCKVAWNKHRFGPTVSPQGAPALCALSKAPRTRLQGGFTGSVYGTSNDSHSRSKMTICDRESGQTCEIKMIRFHDFFCGLVIFRPTQLLIFWPKHFSKENRLLKSCHIEASLERRIVTSFPIKDIVWGLLGHYRLLSVTEHGCSVRACQQKKQDQLSSSGKNMNM